MKLLTKVTFFSFFLTFFFLLVFFLSCWELYHLSQRMFLLVEINLQLNKLTDSIGKFQTQSQRVLIPYIYSSALFSNETIKESQKKIEEKSELMDKEILETLFLIDSFRNRNPFFFRLTPLMLSLEATRQIKAQFMFEVERKMNLMLVDHTKSDMSLDGYLKKMDITLYRLSERIDAANSEIKHNIQLRLRKDFVAIVVVLMGLLVFILGCLFAMFITIKKKLRYMQNLVRDIHTKTNPQLFFQESGEDELSQLQTSVVSLSNALDDAQKMVEDREVALQIKALQLKALSNKLLFTKEQELKAISEYVHDELGQLLIAIKLDILTFGKKLPENSSLMPLLNEVSLLVNEALESARNLARQLRPPLLDRLGLMGSLQQLVQFVTSHYPVQIKFDVDAVDSQFEYNLRVSIYRIIQESLTNIMKHSQATQVYIRLFQQDMVLNIRIEDNGVGFNPDSKNWSLGLWAIQERVDFYEGSLTIVANQPSGSVLEIQIPNSRQGV